MDNVAEKPQVENMSEEECICQGNCPGVTPEKLSEEVPEDDFSLDDVPELVLKTILEKIPRRELEDSLIDVNYLFQSLVTDILSEKVEVTEFCKKPPGIDDDIDLSVTKELNISAGWTCRWWDYKCEGLTRNYFEELLRQLSPNYLQKLSTPLRNKDQLDIITEMTYLKSLSLDILKPSLDRQIIDQLPRLRNLQDLHLNGLNRFTPDDFQTIVDGCPFLLKMAFPRRCPWAENKFLSILKGTKIKTIRPWSYIGGYDEFKIESQSYRYMLNVLEEIPDLKEIELHLHIFANGREEEEELRKQTELLPQVTELIAKQKSIKYFGLSQAGRNYEEVHDISSLKLANLLATMENLESLKLSSLLATYDQATISSIYRTIGSMKKLQTLLLDEVPITDTLHDVFNNQNLKYLTLRRPSKLNFKSTEDLEAVLRKIGDLPNLEHLRLVLSNDTEHAFANANAAANNPAGANLVNQNQGEEWRLAYSNALENFEGNIRKSVLEMLSKLANQIKRLELNGSWICDSLVIQMPCLPNLEALRLIPAQSRVVVYGENIESKRLSTTVVLSYAQTCCPVLLEPKFLRYHNLLEDHFGYRAGDEPGAAYLEQWQELNRNFRHLSRFEKREKLRELNKMFEANKGTPGNSDEVSYHPDWRTYCKE